MTAIINGDSPSITFSDATTQATSAVVSGKVPFSILPAGSVLQVVNATTLSSTSTTSSSFVATSVAVSITPKFATSKILIMHNGVANIQGSAVWVFYTLYRGATNLYASGSQSAIGGALVAGSSDAQIPVSVIYLDSPATTSSTTYTIYIKNSNGSSTARYNADGWLTTITALEIAA
jgi:hypothetical protein